MVPVRATSSAPPPLVSWGSYVKDVGNLTVYRDNSGKEPLKDEWAMKGALFEPGGTFMWILNAAAGAFRVGTR